MSEQIRKALSHYSQIGDLYRVAICEIALDGKPWARTLDAMSSEARAQLFREYFSHDMQRWARERAEYESGHLARCLTAGIKPVHCCTPG